MIYEAINQVILFKIPKTTKRILDLGCGSGAFGREVKQSISCEIVGVTYSEEEAALAAKNLDSVFVCDLNSFAFPKLGKFDCIICSHILEHLYNPDILLDNLGLNLSANGILIVALPNAMNWKQRLEFLKGRFRYADGGVMDRTHFRFFDYETSLQLVRGAGFTVISWNADGYFPLPGIRKLAPNWARRLDQIATKTLPGLFGQQFIIVAKKSGGLVKS